METLVNITRKVLYRVQESPEHRQEHAPWKEAFPLWREEITRNADEAVTRNAEESGKRDFEHVLKNVVSDIQQTWQALERLTGFNFGIIPPMIYSPMQVGHWINLSIGIVPFEYVTKDAQIVHQNENQEGSLNSIKLNSLTSALLINEYLQCIIKEIEANAELEDVSNILKELYTYLQSLRKVLHISTSAETTGKLYSTLSKIKDITEKLHQISPVIKMSTCTSTVRMLTVTECDLLCRILGLEPEFAHKMFEIDDTWVLHSSPLYFIEDEMEDRFSSNQFDGDLKSDLSLLGFSQEKSQEIANNLDCKYHNMYSPIYWAKEYLEDAFSTDPLLTMIPILDKYGDKPFDQWFDDESDLGLVVKNSTQTHHFQTIRFKTDDSNNIVTSEVVTAMFQDADHMLLFHGVKHANSAHTILKRGIDIKSGGAKLDFSNGSGFYMSDDFKAAKGWALKRKKRPSAIIIFKVPNSLLLFGENEGLDLCIARDKWASVVLYNRTNYEVDNDVPGSVKSETLKFIKGPVCKNGPDIESRKSHDPKPFEIDGRVVMQYCILEKSFAKQISSFIVGVLLYNVSCAQ